MDEGSRHRQDEGVRQEELGIDSVGKSRKRHVSSRPPQLPQALAIPETPPPGLPLVDEVGLAQLLPGGEGAPDVPLHNQLELLYPHQAACNDKALWSGMRTWGGE